MDNNKFDCIENTISHTTKKRIEQMRITAKIKKLRKLNEFTKKYVVQFIWHFNEFSFTVDIS